MPQVKDPGSKFTEDRSEFYKNLPQWRSNDLEHTYIP